MAALTAQADIQELLLPTRTIQHAPATSGVTFFKGALVSRVASTGLITNAAAALGATDYVVGVCDENVTTTVSGQRVKLRTDSAFLIPTSGVTQAMVGELVYATDNNLVTEDAATNTPPGAGVVHEFVSSAQSWIYISFRPAFAVAADAS
jgi:hypothetical protein